MATGILMRPRHQPAQSRVIDEWEKYRALFTTRRIYRTRISQSRIPMIADAIDSLATPQRPKLRSKPIYQGMHNSRASCRSFNWVYNMRYQSNATTESRKNRIRSHQSTLCKSHWAGMRRGRLACSPGSTRSISYTGEERMVLRSGWDARWPADQLGVGHRYCGK